MERPLLLASFCAQPPDETLRRQEMSVKRERDVPISEELQEILLAPNDPVHVTNTEQASMAAPQAATLRNGLHDVDEVPTGPRKLMRAAKPKKVPKNEASKQRGSMPQVAFSSRRLNEEVRKSADDGPEILSTPRKVHNTPPPTRRENEPTNQRAAEFIGPGTSAGASQPSTPVTSARTSNDQNKPQEPPKSHSKSTRVYIADVQPNKIGACVHGRVCSKTTLRQRSRENPTLTVFSFVIQDETGKITVTGWDEVALRTHDLIKVGDCVELTMFKTKAIIPANQQYNTTGHPHELTLTKWSSVTTLSDDTLPPLHSEHLSIIQLQGKEPNSVVDLMAVVFEVGPMQFINCQDGRTRKKRNVTLVDESGRMVTLGLWPDFTDNLNDCEGKAVMFQNLQLREYNSKLMLSTTVNSIITVDSQHPTVVQLNEWFAAEGCTQGYEELDYDL